MFTRKWFTKLNWNKAFFRVQIARIRQVFMILVFLTSSVGIRPNPNQVQAALSAQSVNVQIQVSQSTDDAEEQSDGTIGSDDLDSSDLELTEDGSSNQQVVGMRFQNVDVPAGATILSAYLEFETDETSSTATALTFYGQAADDPLTFEAVTNNILTRPKTTASVDWSPEAWNTVSEKHQTPNIASIVQEIVNRGGWASGNSMVFIVEGSGTRVAKSYDGEAGNAPLLVIEWTTDPTIYISGTPLSDFNSEPGDNSAEQSYTVSGVNLTDDITINAPTDFEISTTSGSGFGPSLTLTQSGGIVATTPVYARFNRGTEGTSSGDITHESAGATTQNVAVSGEAVSPPENWVAYNDTNTTTGGSSGNITTYTIPSAGTATGLLKDYATGADTPVTATITTHNSPQLDANGVTPNSGTDAYDVFNGIIDLAGGIYYGSSGWYVDITFTGLNPDKIYTFVTTANRDNVAYPDRISNFIIQDITAATNASTSGTTITTTTLADDTTTINTYNTVNGYVARWTNIQPGPDGDFTVRAEAHPDSNDGGRKAYAPSGFMLQEVGDAPAPTCYALTLSHTGQGSTPGATPGNSTDCPTGEYIAGESISLSGASPDTGWQIESWYGTGDDSSTANTNSLTMPANAHAAGVNYIEPQDLSAGDVIISGFQAANSVGSQNPAEFIELFNTTDQVISLENMNVLLHVDADGSSAEGVVVDWQLSDETPDLTGKTIAPHSFFLIAESDVAAPSGVHDLGSNLDIATGEGGATERAIALELVIGSVHTDYVLYGRNTGSDGDNPDGDIPFDGSSWPRSEVVRNTIGGSSFAEGLVRRESEVDLYAGYDVAGYYTDEDALGDGYPNGVWTSPHDDTDDNYEARNSLSPAVFPPVFYNLTVSDDSNGSVTLTPSGGTYSSGTVVTLTPVPNFGYAFDSWSSVNSGDLSDNGDGTWDITMDANKEVTANFVESSEVTISFQEGVGGYSGTVDTFLMESDADTSHGGEEWVEWDGEDGTPAGPNVGLIRFEDIFGSSPGQIPVGATIVSAQFHYTVNNEGSDGNVNEVIVDWAETVTWNGFGSTAGVQAEDYGAAVATASASPIGNYSIDVTSSLATWSGDPSANKGWIVRPTDGTTNGVEFRSSEYGTVGDRPKLEVIYSTSGPVNQAPDQPVLVQPLDDAVDVSTSPTLEVTVSDPDSDPMDVTFHGREVGAGTGEDFTIIALPDTQKYSDDNPDAYFIAQTTWIAANKDARNIVYVVHEGDIVNTASDENQWIRADAAMDVLDAADVPYGVVPGNHDTPTSYYNTYFGISRFSGKSYYGGYYGSDNDNNYTFINAGGMDFIFINLEYEPGTDEMNWADGLFA